PSRLVELAVARPQAAPFGYEGARPAELLDPVVAGIGDVNAAVVPVHGHVAGLGELADGRGQASPLAIEAIARPGERVEAANRPAGPLAPALVLGAGTKVIGGV